MEIFFLRHGETEGNCHQKYLGVTDLPLNENGRKQAQKAACLLQDHSFDNIYCSPLKRTLETASYLGRPYEILDGLKERNFGIFENLTYKEIRCMYPKEWNAFTTHWKTYAIPDGESAAEAFERHRQAVRFIADKKEKTVLVVTHLGAIRDMVTSLLGLPMDQLWHFRIENAGIVRLVSDHDYWYLVFPSCPGRKSFETY